MVLLVLLYLGGDLMESMEIPKFNGVKDEIDLMEWFRMVKEYHSRLSMPGTYLTGESSIWW